MRLDRDQLVLRNIDIVRAGAKRHWALHFRRRVGHGLYVPASLHPLHPVPPAFLLSVRHANLIVCLESALELQGLRPLSMKTLWVARQGTSWRPRGLGATRIEALQFSARWAALGVVTMVHRQLRVRVTGIARTVADLFAYRVKVGSDAAVRALEEVVRLRACCSFELERMLRARRVHAYVRPLLQAALKRWPDPPRHGPNDFQRFPWLPTPALEWSQLPQRLAFPWTARGRLADVYEPLCFYEPWRRCACRFLPPGTTLDGRRCVCMVQHS